MDSDCQRKNTDRSMLRMLNPDRAACQERIEREHLEAIRGELTRLPLAADESETLEHWIHDIHPEILNQIREMIQELVVIRGEEVLFAMTYEELDRMEPFLRQHRMIVITTLLHFWKHKALLRGAGRMVSLIEAVIDCASDPDHWRYG